ncbi:RNA-guided endonuclease InsQ/TnpB family protein [Paenibacillus wynnii]|uniref:RNA-guided endonuclease InsQ/TnpB family protein n=1 Tax=Paenibacillus wynnii TaxID=268407 RepID=UPI0027929882|nr:transposase [Paenibacillus wynnii]MDQ0196444.1 putative transposase [Paenibacillus wynnii]
MEKRTSQIIIKKNHRLYDYFNQTCVNAKKLYNVTNFYLRQTYTALKSEKLWHPLQKEVLDAIETQLPLMNDVQMKAFEKRKAKEILKPSEKSKENKPNLFHMPTKEKAFLSYNLLDSLFKIIKQPDYLALPMQSSQATMKKVFDDWKSFFEAMKQYNIHPTSFTGKPRSPAYKQGQKEVYFTNQDCVIKENKYLKFPKTKTHLNIGKLGIRGTLKQVRVIPKYDVFIVELVMDVESRLAPAPNKDAFMSIDLGVNNLAAVVTNTGMTPQVFNGNPLKSMNQFYNKERARLYSLLRQGEQPDEGMFTSKTLRKLDAYRHNRMMDYAHKVSFNIIKLAIQEKISTLIIGKNVGWKQQVSMRKKDKQHFLFISHEQLIQMIQYKANEVGIEVILTEESYTSKASSIDNDFIPTYGDKLIPLFSGRRIARGLYRSKQGLLLNADVNGAYNILRKKIPHALTSEGSLSLASPTKIRIA